MITKSCMTLFDEIFLVCVMQEGSCLEAHVSRDKPDVPSGVWYHTDSPNWKHPFLVKMLDEAMSKLRDRAMIAQSLLIVPLED